MEKFKLKLQTSVLGNNIYGNIRPRIYLVSSVTESNLVCTYTGNNFCREQVISKYIHYIKMPRSKLSKSDKLRLVFHYDKQRTYNIENTIKILNELEEKIGFVEKTKIVEVDTGIYANKSVNIKNTYYIECSKRWAFSPHTLSLYLLLLRYLIASIKTSLDELVSKVNVNSSLTGDFSYLEHVHKYILPLMSNLDYIYEDEDVFRNFTSVNGITTLVTTNYHSNKSVKSKLNKLKRFYV